MQQHIGKINHFASMILLGLPFGSGSVRAAQEAIPPRKMNRKYNPFPSNHSKDETPTIPSKTVAILPRMEHTASPLLLIMISYTSAVREKRI